MKAIKFRPLRRVKKTGRIAVASYMSWRNVKTADYSKFELVISAEYKQLPQNEFVFDHAGNQLFWADYDPESIPVFNYSALKEVFDVTKIHETNPQHAINWNSDYDRCLGKLHYCSDGMDCDGVPAFSHYTADDIAEHHFCRINDFEPLTVGIVVKWFGWFLCQLDNSHLKIGDE